jgi:hypothetical protein
MRITMVKKRTRDGSECGKCADATARLTERGLWGRVDEVVWAVEDDPESPGNALGRRLGVERAPFFVVRDDSGAETVYTSVLKLIRERLGQEVSDREETRNIDPDDVGGI